MKPIESKWFGVFLAIGTPLFAFVLHHFATVRPAHRFETVEEIGRIRVYAGRPMPNNAGDQLAFFQYRTIASRTNDTWGLYLKDVVGGKRQLIDELSTHTWREDGLYDRVRTLGWSPDDRYFAYARNKFHDLVICDVRAGGQLAVFPTKVALATGAWLTAEKLVCSDGKEMFEFVLATNGWDGPKNFATEMGGLRGLKTGKSRPIEAVQRYSSDSLLWRLRDEAIMKSSSVPEESPSLVWDSKLWNTASNKIIDFVCSTETENILLHGRDKEGEYIATLNSNEKQNSNTAKILNRFDYKDAYVSGVRFINKGRGYAFFLKSFFGANALLFKTDMDNEGLPYRVPLEGEIKSFDARGEQLFAFGAMTNEPIGIWKYGISSGKIEQMASNQERPFRYAISQPTSKMQVTNASGDRLTAYVIPPSNAPVGRTPSLVLAIMGAAEKGQEWDRYPQTIANCGAYFVSVDRQHRKRGKQGERGNLWAEDLFTVYETMTQNVVFDTNNVYLLAISEGAPDINHLLKTKPNYWRGAIFLSPGSLPDPDCITGKRLFVDIGGLDPIWGTNSIRAKEFQDRAARAGEDMRLFIRPDVGHNCRLLSVEKERLHQLAAFLDDAD